MLIISMIFSILVLNETVLDDCIGNRCSISQSGDLTKTDKAVDGIFGFGPGPLSVVSQLSSRGITPKVFSHCLKGDGDGGGVLVLGEILEPSIVYSPLVPSQYVLFFTSFLIFFPQLVDNFPLIFFNIVVKGMYKAFLKEIDLGICIIVNCQNLLLV